MRIVVDDIAASKTGALSVLRDFYNAVIEYESSRIGDRNEWIFVLGDKLLEETDNIKVIVRDDVKSSRKNRLMFDLKTGADFFESLKPDVLFSMQNTLPRGYKGRQVLYVHQPLPYQTWKRFSFLKPEEREYAVYQHLIGRMIDASVKRADKVIVQTQWMRDAVVKKTGVPADKVVKILPDISVEHTDGSSVIITPCQNNRFFYPAGEILYKNHGLILEAVGGQRGVDQRVGHKAADLVENRIQAVVRAVQGEAQIDALSGGEGGKLIFGTQLADAVEAVVAYQCAVRVTHGHGA